MDPKRYNVGEGGIVMMEYRIIKRGSEVELARDVNNAVKEGWRPQGGVSHAARGLLPLIALPIVWAQAMVRETK